MEICVGSVLIWSYFRVWADNKWNVQTIESAWVSNSECRLRSQLDVRDGRSSCVQCDQLLLHHPQERRRHSLSKVGFADKQQDRLEAACRSRNFWDRMGTCRVLSGACHGWLFQYNSLSDTLCLSNCGTATSRISRKVFRSKTEWLEPIAATG